MLIEDLLYTLAICEKSLPADTHLVHYERLREIKQIIEVYCRMQGIVE